MRTVRRGCGACTFKDKLYVCGGNDGIYSLASVEVYDPASNTWLNNAPSMNSCRANVAVSVVNDTIFAVGGFTGKQFLNNCEYLDIKNNEWTTFLKKNVNGLKLVKENTLTDLNQLNTNDRMKLNKLKNQESNSNHGDRKEQKSTEFKKSKELIEVIEVEGEKIEDETN